MKRILCWKYLILLSLSGFILGTVTIGLCEEKEASFAEKELYAVDARSTATAKDWISAKGLMEKDKLWNHIVKVLSGVEGKRTYVLATSMDNIPLSTTIEFYINPDKKVLYGFAEKGTEKLIHIKNNPKVGLNWHEEFVNDFSKTLCVQIRGTAELDYSRLANHHSCRFGKWYFGEGMQMYGNLSSFKAVDEPHAKIHALAKEAVSACNSGDRLKAERIYKEMENLSDQIGSLLDGIKRECK